MTRPDDLRKPCAARVADRLLEVGALNDEDYAEAIGFLGADLLANVVRLVGYYSIPAMTLSTFRPPLEE